MNAIVCVDENWGIGKDNHLLFNIPEDMEFFRTVTNHNIVVMGANTFNSLPNGALKGRINIVLDKKKEPRLNCTVVQDIDELKQLLCDIPSFKIDVIGGASVYKQLLNECEHVFVTKVRTICDADVRFPNLDADDSFECSFGTGWLTSFTGLQYSFNYYSRKV